MSIFFFLTPVEEPNMKALHLRLGMPHHVSCLGKEVLPQQDWPRGCNSSWINSGNHVWFLQSGANRRTKHLTSLMTWGSLMTWRSKAIGGKAKRRILAQSWARASHPSRNKLVNESCLMRQRGPPLPSRRPTKLSEPLEGVFYILLQIHFSRTACMLLGSICPARELPWVNAGCNVFMCPMRHLDIL